MVKKDSQIIPVTPSVIQTDQSAETLKLATLLTEMDLDAPRIPARELIDTEFIILRARAFESRFGEGQHAWFCVCVPANGGDLFTTILGGAACVDLLDAWAASGFDNPLQVKLEWVEGGKYRGYYRLV